MFKKCLHKWILISIATEAAMLEDSMTSRENVYNCKLPLACLDSEKRISWHFHAYVGYCLYTKMLQV